MSTQVYVVYRAHAHYAVRRLDGPALARHLAACNKRSHLGRVFDFLAFGATEDDEKPLKKDDRRSSSTDLDLDGGAKDLCDAFGLDPTAILALDSVKGDDRILALSSFGADDEVDGPALDDADGALPLLAVEARHLETGLDTRPPPRLPVLTERQDSARWSSL